MELGKTLKILISIAIVYTLTLFIVACAAPSGEFFYGTLGLGDKRIAMATQSNIVMYDLDGHLVDVAYDGSSATEIPKGLAPYDPFSFAVLVDGADRISKLNVLDMTMSNLAVDANLTGTLYQMAWDEANGRYYAVEGNTIEAFTKSGARLGAPYIATTVGACVLSTPRGLTVTRDGRLIVTSTVNNRIAVYNISTATATCISTNTNFGTSQPAAVIEHTDGLLYIAGYNNGIIYSLPSSGVGTPTTVWAANLTVIRNPTSLLEMPDGTLLVGSDFTNSVERITTAGVQVGNASFVKDVFSSVVWQMMLIGGE